MPPVIDIDFDVYKELTIKRKTESDSYNDVLRRMLNLDAKKTPSLSEASLTPRNGIAWVSKGVTFPDGTEFRATYKGRVCVAKIVRGRLVVENEKVATSLSQAARFITNNSVDGWVFWEVKRPSDLDWRKATDLRNK